eukprot:gene28304-37354_t
MSDIESDDGAEAIASSNVKVRLIPWVEKYRPEKVEDVSHQDEIIQTLKKSIEIGNIPHLLFHGPPGTGKTTTILAFARALYGPDLYRTRILELNASDERGIKVIREKVKIFAQASVGAQKVAGYPCPRFKLIILDEADTMTPDSQSALRRIIENYSKVTRFCLICNYVTRVIEPLASRCAKFRFKTLPPEAMLHRMKEIAGKEHVQIDEVTMSLILKTSGGDMRKAVTYLQSSHQLSGNAPITIDTVVDISGQVHPHIMDKLWEQMHGYSFDALKLAVNEIAANGYPMSAIISQLHDEVISKPDLQDVDKALIAEKIAEADQCLVDGSSELIQLLDVSAFIMRRYMKFDSTVDMLTQKH